jgi:hypothetical protein
MIPCNGLIINARASTKTLGEITASKKSVLYGFYDNVIRSSVDDGKILFVYGRRLIENDESKLNKFELPKHKSEKLPKIYGDIFLFMYNSNNYMYEDFTKDMWDIISIKK